MGYWLTHPPLYRVGGSGKFRAPTGFPAPNTENGVWRAHLFGSYPPGISIEGTGISLGANIFGQSVICADDSDSRINAPFLNSGGHTEWSIILVCTLDAFSATYPFLIDMNSNSSTNRRGVQPNRQSFGKYYLSVGSSNVYTGIPCSANSNQVVALCLTQLGGMVSLTVNDGTVSYYSTAKANTPANSDVALFNRNSTIGSPSALSPGAHIFAAGVCRPLSQAAGEAAVRDPYHFLFAPASDYLWAPVAGGGGTTVSVGLASSSESGLAITESKILAAGLAQSAESALSATVAKILSAAQSQESDSAFAHSISKQLALGLSGETSQAFTISLAASLAVGLVAETNLALAVAASGAIAVGLSAETSSALAVGSAKLAVLGLSGETDSALVIGPAHALAAGLSAETDAAQSTGWAKALAAGLGSETDTAIGIVLPRTVLIGLSEDTESALSSVAVRTYSAGQIEETDTALATSWTRGVLLGQAGSVEAAFAITIEGALIIRAEGLEFTIPENRLHFVLPVNRLHFN